jgi:hypothetical protein
MADGDLSTQFEKISDMAKSAADKLKATNERTGDQLESDVADARHGAEAAADCLRAKADDAADAASSHCQQLRGKWQAHVADVHARAERARMDADGAAVDADMTEAYACDAIDFVLDAVEEAEYAVLDAIYSRKAAAALRVVRS